MVSGLTLPRRIDSFTGLLYLQGVAIKLFFVQLLINWMAEGLIKQIL